MSNKLYDDSTRYRRNPNLNLEYRCLFNPIWESFKAAIARRPKVRSFAVIDHGLVGSEFDCGCESALDGFEYCETMDGDNPAEAFSWLLDGFKVGDAERFQYENQNGHFINESSTTLHPKFDYFDLARRLNDYFGDRAIECKDCQYWRWYLPDEPSGVAETFRVLGIGPETDIPERENFKCDESFAVAMEEFEDRCTDIELNPQFKYRFCLKFNLDSQSSDLNS